MVNLNLEHRTPSIPGFLGFARASMLIAILLMLTGGFALGQSEAELELRLEREAKYEAWKVIRRYQQNHSLNNSTRQDKFFRLFSEKATHVLDVPFYNQNNEDVDLLVRDYMSMYALFFEEAKNNRVEVRPLHMDVKREQGGMYVEVYCQKKFLGEIDVLGSEVSYPNAQHLIFTMAVKNGNDLMEHWNSGVGNTNRYALPPSLELDIQGVHWSPVQETYFLALIEKNCGKSELSFPCDKQVKIVDSPNWRLMKSETECWVIRDSNGRFIDDVMHANQYGQEASQAEVLLLQQIPANIIKPWSWQVGIGGGAKSNGSVEDELGNQGSWNLQQAYGVHVGMGYSLEQTNQFIWDAAFSVGASTTQFEYKAPQVAFEGASVDPDGFQYIRQSTASEWIESNNEQAVFAEVSTMGLWSVPDASRRKLWLGLQGGYSVGIWSQVQTNSEAQVFHKGHYPELYGITIDETGIYDFGSHNGTGSGQYQWKGSGQINLSAVIGLQVNPELMLVGKVGGVRATRRAGDDELRYMDGTNILNAASQQLQSLTLNGMAFSIGLRKRITGGEEIKKGCHVMCR